MNEVITSEASAQVQSFTQEEVQKMIEMALATERADAERRIQAVRDAAVAEVARLKGEKPTPQSATAYLYGQRQQQEANAVEVDELKKIFVNPGSGAVAAKLKKESPELYESLREKAVRHGILSARPQHQAGTRKIFRNE